ARSGEGPSRAAEGVPPAVLSRELLRFGIRHGFDTSRDINQNSHFADVDLGLRATPLDYLWFSYDTSFNAGRGTLDAQDAWFTLNGPGWVAPLHTVFQPASSFSVGYRYVRKHVDQRGYKECQVVQERGAA